MGPEGFREKKCFITPVLTRNFPYIPDGLLWILLIHRDYLKRPNDLQSTSVNYFLRRSGTNPPGRIFSYSERARSVKRLSCCESAVLQRDSFFTGSTSSVCAATEIGVYPFCESKPNLRYVKPDLLSGETDNLPPCGSVFSASGLPSSSGRAFPKQKNTRIPGAVRSGTVGKRIKVQGYGRWIDPGPCHRPLPGSEAAHIRYPARTGQLGASQGQVRLIKEE